MSVLRSAGVLVYRRPASQADRGVEVLLVHPGGPFWARKDLGAWSIPKGELEPGEDPRTVAAREFAEELGVQLPAGDWLELGELRQRGGKHVTAWAVAGDVDVREIASNTFELEWPPRSGRRQAFPEVDRAAWFGTKEARRRILASQVPFVDRLCDALGLAAGED